MNIKEINQIVKFYAPAIEIYNLLMDPSQHAEITKGEVNIDPVVGGKFSIFEGYAKGENLELLEGKRIKQKWWFDEGWPEDFYSICTFDLRENKEGQTVLYFQQSNVPEENHESLSKGWEDFYWLPMREIISKRKELSTSEG
jgi:activator of HSP90 ATPase